MRHYIEILQEQVIQEVNYKHFPNPRVLIVRSYCVHEHGYNISVTYIFLNRVN
jgi:hypothetical protein